jgi:hypothetical protein
MERRGFSPGDVARRVRIGYLRICGLIESASPVFICGPD